MRSTIREPPAAVHAGALCTSESQPIKNGPLTKTVSSVASSPYNVPFRQPIRSAAGSTADGLEPHKEGESPFLPCLRILTP